MRRREFVVSLGGSAMAWACGNGAHGQERIARVGILMVVAETDPDAARYMQSLEGQLEATGWKKGRNLELNYRWGASNPEQLSRFANELVQAAPNVLLAFGTPSLAALHKATTTIPIVFAAVSDPVAQGFVTSLARPGGNVTGFSNFEPTIGSKWLQLLKEVAPAVSEVGIMFNPRTSPYNALWVQSIERAGPDFGMTAHHVSIENDEDVRASIATLVGKGGTGLIVPSDPFTFERAGLIASLANVSKLPAIYAFSRFVHEGGLVSYGIDLVEQMGKGGGYVDRVLRGDKAGELPVQGPTRYTLAINLKTARAIGLTIPPKLLFTADEAIE